MNEVAFDVADAQRTSGTGESWINGTVTISGDGNQLDGLRLHSYNGPLQFSGTDIDAFNISNSYITGFNGSQAISYNDTDGTASTGWIFSGNLIGGVAGGVFGPKVVEHLGPQRSAILGLALFPLECLITAFASSPFIVGGALCIGMFGAVL